jgi:hypothetical protein
MVRNGKVEPHQVSFQRMMFVRLADGSVRPAVDQFSALKFDPAVFRPGPWRTIEIDVTSTEMRARWLTEKRGLAPFPNRGPWNPVAEYAVHQTNLDRSFRGTGIVIPNWSPRMPLGIYASRSALSIRNVIISPLP